MAVVSLVVLIKDTGVNVALIMFAGSMLTLAGAILMFYMTHKWNKEAVAAVTASTAAVKEVKDLAININVAVDGKLDAAIEAVNELEKKLSFAIGRREGSEAERDMTGEGK
jgi:hypothetical protein